MDSLNPSSDKSTPAQCELGSKGTKQTHSTPPVRHAIPASFSASSGLGTTEERRERARLTPLEMHLRFKGCIVNMNMGAVQYPRFSLSKNLEPAPVDVESVLAQAPRSFPKNLEPAPVDVGSVLAHSLFARPRNIEPHPWTVSSAFSHPDLPGCEIVLWRQVCNGDLSPRFEAWIAGGNAMTTELFFELLRPLLPGGTKVILCH